jgi:hypothetical protein
MDIYKEKNIHVQKTPIRLNWRLKKLKKIYENDTVESLGIWRLMHPQAPCQTQNGSRMPNSGIVWELGAHSQLSALEGVEGCAEALGLD